MAQPMSRIRICSLDEEQQQYAGCQWRVSKVHYVCSEEMQ